MRAFMDLRSIHQSAHPDHAVLFGLLPLRLHGCARRSTARTRASSSRGEKALGT